nr:MAG TPA_asm: hypothetical protein [Caudoviricetes sp.]
MSCFFFSFYNVFVFPCYDIIIALLFYNVKRKKLLKTIDI